MHFKSVATFFFFFWRNWCKCKKKNPFGRWKINSTHWHLRSANSASITSLAIRRRLSAGCNVWLLQCPSYSMNVVVHIGKQRLKLSKPCDCHQILTSSRTKRRPVVTLPCEKCEWWGRREWAQVNILKELFVDEETCGDRYGIEHAGRWVDQRVAILADQPLCSHELDEQPSSLPVAVSATACNSAGRWDWTRLTEHVTWRLTSMLFVPSPAVAVFEIW